MSTHAYAFRQNDDGTLTGIYIHSDGYLDGVGRMLAAHYPKREQVDALIALGDLSSLERSLDCPEGHSFNTPADGCSVAYHRDRGEPWKDAEPKPFAGINTALAYCSGIDYVYLWTEVPGWQCVGRFGKPYSATPTGGAK